MAHKHTQIRQVWRNVNEKRNVKAYGTHEIQEYIEGIAVLSRPSDTQHMGYVFYSRWPQ